ncbi:MAG TPA: sigma-70 family RNA polymerase sigma factor, partial [Anaerolineales bacterium]|nr:sigma-70 family RNA polymerase sigma factor [Anaerolineales bacterium]
MKSTTDYARFDDEQLISLIAQQQQGALAQLYDRYNRLVFSLALVIVNDRATAEEITLDVFMRIWQKAGTYRADQAKVSTWLTHIARNHSIDILRRRSVRLDQSAVHWEDTTFRSETPEHDPQEFTELSLRRERVHAALAQLPDDQRQALFLAYFSGYTHSQIAEVLKQPLGTIKTRLRLAMRKLREYLVDE